MAAVTRAYADGRFGQLHYRRAGPPATTRPPLMLFHMSPYAGVIYEAFMAAMGEDRTVIAPDTPGFGNSDPPLFDDGGRPGIADYAAAMGDLMDAQGLRGVDLMGYHTGAKIALELARRRPRQVRRIVMVSAAIWTEAELAEHRAQFKRMEIDPEGAHLVKWWKAALFWSMRGRTLDQVARVFPARMLNPDISWWGHAAAFDYSTAAALQVLDHEILVLNPEDDLWSFTPRAKGYLRNGRVLDLPGWSHGFLDVKTADAAKIVRDFLDRDTNT
jgi:pimeloyl-ACP methyl ester carboxylesterase